MIVDTSAVLAMLLDEPEREAFTRLLGGAARRTISAGTRIELAIVALNKGGGDMDQQASALLSRVGIEVAPVTAAQADLARDAYRRFGRGSGHAARLNFADCFAYALARERDDVLLFKGDDFRQTDVRAAA